MAKEEAFAVKRPRVADHTAEHRLERAQTYGTGAAGLACAAFLLVATRAGMLYDRVVASDGAAWLQAVAVPLGAILVGGGVVLWALTEVRPALLRRSSLSALVIASLALLLWAAIRAVGAPDRVGSAVQLCIVAVCVGIALLLGVQYRRAGMLAVAIACLILSGLILSVMGLREYLMEWRGGNPGWRVFAGFAVPNFLAGFLVGVIPVTAALFLGVRDRLSALVSGLVLVLETLTMLLTQSRLGVLALGVGGLVFVGIAAWRKLVRGAAARRAWLLIGTLIIVGAVGARPVINRLKASRDQSYSARFRAMTWQGAWRMFRAHPWAGVGTGSFDAVYPRYAVVGYTQHAHNSYLQWACENGVPGLFFLVVGLVISAWLGLRATGGPERPGWPLGQQRLLAAGLAAGLAAVVTHNVFDSDIYVPANMVLVASLCALTAALGKRRAVDTNPAGKSYPTQQVPRWLWASLAILGGLVLVGGGARLLMARIHLVTAGRALAEQDVIGALEAYQKAASAMPVDPEPHLMIAMIHDRLNETDAAMRALKTAVRVAPSGKTHYRLGRYLLTQGKPREAALELEKALRYDPLHLRTMLTLAEAYGASGRGHDAEAVYLKMVALHNSPVGQVRAVPEVVDWEYGVAYAGLAERAVAEGNMAKANGLLEKAEAILGQLWATRDDLMVRIRVTPEAMREATARYEWVLSQRIACLRRLGLEADATRAADRLRRFRQEYSRETGSSEP